MTTKLDPVHVSRLKLFAKSPLHFQANVQPDDKTALLLGSAVDSLLFPGQRPVVEYTEVRRGKAWDAFKVEHDDAIILIESEMALVKGMVTAMQASHAAMAVLEGEAQKQIEWEWKGRACSSRLDVLAPSHIVDLKTTRCAHPSKFMWQVRDLSYHAQLAFYREAVRSFGFTISECYIVAVENKPPHPVAVYRLSEKALLEGERLWQDWFEQLLTCEANNQWPGYDTGIMALDVPTKWEPQDDDDSDSPWGK